MKTSFKINPQTFYKLLRQIGGAQVALTIRKNKAYGFSFHLAGEFLRLLYPNGIKPTQYQDALILVRIFDKCARIASRKRAFGESPYRDIIGYGLLAATFDKSL